MVIYTDTFDQLYQRMLDNHVAATKKDESLQFCPTEQGYGRSPSGRAIHYKSSQNFVGAELRQSFVPCFSSFIPFAMLGNTTPLLVLILRYRSDGLRAFRFYP